MPKLTIGTFNVENLFLRYKPLNQPETAGTSSTFDFDKATVNSFTRVIDDMGPIGSALRTFTANVILAQKPHVLAVQEVENLEALDRFNRHFLKKRYPFMMVIDGNDPRQIDVGVLSMFDFVKLRTHRFEPKGAGPTTRVFARDCLEVVVDAEGSPLHLYVNHFTSKLPKKDSKTGKIHHGEKRRLAQATRVAELLKQNHGEALAGDWVVMGDLNAGPGEAELKPLLDLGVENVLARLPNPTERWTHFFERAPANQSPAEQLDYVLLSPDLAAKNPAALPVIERRGLADRIVKKINKATGAFGPKITGNFTQGAKGGASDHCAVTIELSL